LRGLGRQLLDLAGHDRESLPGITRSGSLDGRVQCEKIGLSRDGVDQRDDFADLACSLA
jgi:hypothetical protein